MGKAMQNNNERHSLQFPMQLKVPEIPKAFTQHKNVMMILCSTIEEFGHEEQQALYYYCYLRVPICDIAKKVGLSQGHVASVLGLYLERLTNQLDFFKKAVPYDNSDLLPVSEILSLEHLEQIV